jgi:hypothetical protein
MVSTMSLCSELLRVNLSRYHWAKAHDELWWMCRMLASDGANLLVQVSLGPAWIVVLSGKTCVKFCALFFSLGCSTSRIDRHPLFFAIFCVHRKMTVQIYWSRKVNRPSKQGLRQFCLIDMPPIQNKIFTYVISTLVVSISDSTPLCGTIVFVI